MRTQARVFCSIWQDPEWCNLSRSAQGTYLMLLSQPKLSLAGCLDFMPTRWTNNTADDVNGLTADLADLETARFIVIDRGTEELLVRTFVRHDIGKSNSPKLIKGMWAAWEGILSAHLRRVLLDNLPDELWADAPADAHGLRQEPPEPDATEWATEGVSNGQTIPLAKPTEGVPNLLKPLTSPATTPETVSRPSPATESPTIEPVHAARSSPPANGHPAPKASPEVRRVFEAWVKSVGRSAQTVLDRKRIRLIANALKLYPLDDVVDAVTGWEKSPHHRGENDRRTVYNDLGLLLRDAEHIEQFIAFARGEGLAPETVFT